MLANFFKKTINEAFVVIDPTFPQKVPLGFRNTEINEYFKKIDNVKSYTMSPMKPGNDAWFPHGYGITREQFNENKQGYLKLYPQNKYRIEYLDPNKHYNFKLAYSFFLAETYTLLPFYEKYKIPFVFVLYPGGAFGLNFEASDSMLKKIFQSSQFKGVIVTQKITMDYLIKKDFCPKDNIHFIYGGFVQFAKEEVKPKKYYKKDKKTFDLCFVAAKYSDKGIDKGFDLFIDAAKLLSKKTKDIRFHVIGPFDESDIDVSDITSRITFYGFKQPDFLLDFYSGMDIFMGYNRPNKIYEGSFDGFPLGIDSGYCGVALFVGDELKLNKYYKPDEEIVLLQPDPAKIADKILSYYNNPGKLKELSLRGQQITQKLFDTEYQINERLKVFGRYVHLERAEKDKVAI